MSRMRGESCASDRSVLGSRAPHGDAMRRASEEKVSSGIKKRGGSHGTAQQ
jgi:hypothetical protein